MTDEEYWEEYWKSVRKIGQKAYEMVVSEGSKDGQCNVDLPALVLARASAVAFIVVVQDYPEHRDALMENMCILFNEMLHVNGIEVQIGPVRRENAPKKLSAGPRIN